MKQSSVLLEEYSDTSLTAVRLLQVFEFSYKEIIIVLCSTFAKYEEMMDCITVDTKAGEEVSIHRIDAHQVFLTAYQSGVIDCPETMILHWNKVISIFLRLFSVFDGNVEVIKQEISNNIPEFNDRSTKEILLTADSAEICNLEVFQAQRWGN